MIEGDMRQPLLLIGGLEQLQRADPKGRRFRPLFIRLGRPPAGVHPVLHMGRHMCRFGRLAALFCIDLHLNI